MFEIELLGEPDHSDEVHRVATLFGETGDPDAGESSARPAPERNVLLWLLEVTVIISAPVSWWRQAEQQDIHVFPLRRRSADGHRLLRESDFEGTVAREMIAVLNNYIRDGQPETAIRLLPTNFIQRGLAKVSYRALRDIHASLADTQEGHWKAFLEFVTTLPYHELIVE